MRAAALVLLTLFLSACSTYGSFLGIDDQLGAPQAFPKDSGQQLDLSGIYADGLVIVRNVEGPPPEIGREIARRSARAASRLEVPAMAGDGPLTADVMVGYAELEGAVVRIEWSLQRRGREPQTFLVRAGLNAAAQGGAWAALSGDTIDVAAEETGRRLAQIYAAAPESTALAREEASLLAQARVRIAVSGAPGDGDRALVRAMSESLAARGVRTVEHGEGAYAVRAAVKVMADAEANADMVEIVWRVLDPAGHEIGRAEQANQVPKGALGKRWGDTAFAAASAAADDVTRLILREQALTAAP